MALEGIDEFTDNRSTAYSTNTFDPTHENWYWVAVTNALGQSRQGTGNQIYGKFAYFHLIFYQLVAV